MKEDIKKLWIKALQSGKYKKGIDALHLTKNTFCCLGVLCDLYRKKTGKGEWINWNFKCKGVKEMESNLLPKKVSLWAGLKTLDPVVNGDETLSYYNDHKKLSFKEIAKLIEKDL